MKTAPTSKNKSTAKWDRYFSICLRTARPLLNNEIKAQEAAQDAWGQAFPHLQSGNVRSPTSYLRAVTRTRCLEILQSPAAKDLSLDAPINAGDSRTLADYVPAPASFREAASTTALSAFAKLERMDPPKASGILKSIELVDELFRLKTEIRSRKSEAAYLFNTREAVNAAAKRLRIFPAKPTTKNGRKDDLRTSELRRYVALCEKDPFERTVEERAELTELKKDYLKLELRRGLSDLQRLVEGFIYADPVLNPLIRTYGDFEDLKAVRRLRVQPIKVLVGVWHKALKRGREYGDLKLIKALALEFKEKTWGTPRRYLFDGLTEKNFNTIRKRALYSRNKALKRFSEKVFELSFPAAGPNF